VFNTEIYQLPLSLILLALFTATLFKLSSKYHKLDVDDIVTAQKCFICIGLFAVVALTIFNGFRIEDKPVDMGSTVTKKEIETYHLPTTSEIEAANQKALNEERASLSKRIEEGKQTQNKTYDRWLKNEENEVDNP